MASLPTGTATFLFTDIEGSMCLLQELGDRRVSVTSGQASVAGAGGLSNDSRAGPQSGFG
jgi:hypothetical protein